MNRLMKYFLIIGLLISTFICPNQIFAQDINDIRDEFLSDDSKVFFTKVDAGNQMRASNSRLQQLNNSKKSKRVDIVRLPDKIYSLTSFSFYVNEDSERISFQNFGTKLIVERKSLKILSDTEVAWTGKVFKMVGKEQVGDVTLIVDRNNNVTGSIDLEGDFYEVKSLGNSGLHALRTVDNSYQKDLNQRNDVKSTGKKMNKVGKGGAKPKVNGNFQHINNTVFCNRPTVTGSLYTKCCIWQRYRWNNFTRHSRSE
ncbi:hypothetical protein [Gracilimonas halophila]|uniref:FecR family protein n=1 Tax=Gracilimonas halophila TaxID=1834464 RepID=A0ABW5JJS9_9BACT